MNENNLIVEEYTLPSEGKIYIGKDVDKHIRLRSMTTADEMKRLSRSELQYKSLAELIDNCTVGDTKISAYDMCIGDFQFAIHKLRSVTYGSEYPLECTCPYCLKKSREVIDLDTLNILKFDESILDNFEFDLPKTGHHIKLRMQTPRLLDYVQQKVSESKSMNIQYSGEPAFLFTIVSMIDTIDGEKPNPITIDNWVYNLPMMDVNYIVGKADKINQGIGVDTQLQITCDLCGMTYPASFRITNEFFRPKVV